MRLLSPFLVLLTPVFGAIPNIDSAIGTYFPSARRDRAAEGSTFTLSGLQVERLRLMSVRHPAKGEENGVFIIPMQETLEDRLVNQGLLNMKSLEDQLLPIARIAKDQARNVADRLKESVEPSSFDEFISLLPSPMRLEFEENLSSMYSTEKNILKLLLGSIEGQNGTGDTTDSEKEIEVVGGDQDLSKSENVGSASGENDDDDDDTPADEESSEP